MGCGIDLGYVGFFYGFTHLHACCYWGEKGMGTLDKDQYTDAILPVIGWLLDGRVDTTVRDKEGHTAYELAIEKGMTERAERIGA
jgi:ankyrin repeat protein